MLNKTKDPKVVVSLEKSDLKPDCYLGYFENIQRKKGNVIATMIITNKEYEEQVGNSRIENIKIGVYKRRK